MSTAEAAVSAGRGPGDRELPGWAYKAMLLGASLIWGGSYLALKGALDVLPAAWLIAIRFLASGAILALALLPRLRRNLDGSHLLAGGAIGLLGGMGYLVQNLGLADTTPSNNAFLTATYCVMVPFVNWALARRRPTGANVAAAVLCLAGVGFVSMGDALTLSLRAGDWLTLLGAVFFALQIVCIARLAPAHDMLTLTVVEFFVMGLVPLAVALATEPLPAIVPDADLALQLAYVILLSSVAATVLQNVGQAHVAPAQASLLMCLESVFGVALAVVLYGDPVTWQLVVGFALIFVSVVLSELGPALRRPRRRR